MPDNDHCCVPAKQKCVTDKRKDKSLTFHNIPKGKTLRKKWIIAIRRDPGITDSMKVCSLHFDYDDFKLGTTRRRIKSGVGPSRFAWTNAQAIPKRKSPKKRR